MGCSKLNRQDRQYFEIECSLSFLTVPGAGYKAHNPPLAARFAYTSNQPKWKTLGMGARWESNIAWITQTLSVPAGPNGSAQKLSALSPVRRYELITIGTHP
jgi:hypothetical protein